MAHSILSIENWIQCVGKSTHFQNGNSNKIGLYVLRLVIPRVQYILLCVVWGFGVGFEYCVRKTMTYNERCFYFGMHLQFRICMLVSGTFFIVHLFLLRLWCLTLTTFNAWYQDISVYINYSFLKFLPARSSIINAIYR